LKDYRTVISERLASENPNSIGTVYDTATGKEWALGYGPLSQDVLVPSFLAAYTNNSVSSQPLSYFPRIPLPNWRLTWEGLTKIGNIKNVLQSATISHSYKSTYIVSNFKTNLYYDDFGTGKSATLYDELNSFYPNQDLTTFNITEQFAPFLGIDMTWVNNLQTRLEYKKSRNMTFSMANKQMTDMSTDEIVVGLGYRIKDVSFTVSSMGGSGRKTNISSDLDIKVDVSVRNNRTVLRRLDTNQDQVSTGQQVVSINTTIDYMLSKSLNLSLFFDKIINNPYVSNQYRNSTTRGGIKLRFSLSQ
jgi:cell surface protein SprA